MHMPLFLLFLGIKCTLYNYHSNLISSYSLFLDYRLYSVMYLVLIKSGPAGLLLCPAPILSSLKERINDAAFLGVSRFSESHKSSLRLFHCIQRKCPINPNLCSSNLVYNGRSRLKLVGAPENYQAFYFLR